MKISLVFPFVLMGCALLGGGQSQREQVSRGAVCGDASIIGQSVGQISSDTQGCGIENAVSVSSVGGVSLSQASIMGCSTARVLDSWVENDLDQILGIKGGGLAEIKGAAHYGCRTRNHKRGAKISEHGKGRAIDISAFLFEDGSTLSVQDDWGRGRNGRLLKRLHKSACGPFSTVLGPGSDGYHEDHFHFDTANHRGGGTYCR